MAPDASSPRLTSTTNVHGRESQARQATARVTAAPAAAVEAAAVDRRPPARTGAVAPAAAPASRGHWLALEGCRVGGHVLPLVLLHPRFGIAIAGGPLDAAALVRQRLERARFPAIFPGVLPILRLSGPDSPVDRAFAGGAPVNVPGGDAWVSMARLALETEASPALPARVGIRARHRRQRHRLLLAGGLAMLLLGAAGLGLALLKPEPEGTPVLAGRAEPAPRAPAALPPVPAPPSAAVTAPPAAAPGRPVERPGLAPAIPAPQAPPVVAAPVPPSGLAAVLPAPLPLPPLPQQPQPPAAARPAAAAPEPRQAEALPLPPPAPSRGSPDPAPATAERRPAPAVQEARNLPPPISAQSIAGAQRCRLITQRIQIGDQVADADIRFLQRGCPD